MEVDRCFAVIHLNNILHNYQQINLLTKGKRIMAVVKADAYGHGSVRVASFLERNGCDFFAVASLEEALELRTGGIQSDILIFGKTIQENFAYLADCKLIQTVHSLAYAKELNSYNKKIRVHLNIDTGMSRFGIYLHHLDELESVLNQVIEINCMENLALEGIYTHFANSDESDSNFYEAQLQLFESLNAELGNHGIKNLLKHAANSAASIAYPKTHLDLVRTGIALYGYPPLKTDLEFKPAMEVFARVTSVKELDDLDTVSYGRTYRVKDHDRIATVAIGYADGYNRALSNNDYLVFNDKKLPLVGRVCMDAIMIKIFDTEIKEGDLLEVFGLKKNLLDICEVLKTIPYEPLCAVSKRVKRIYK